MSEEPDLGRMIAYCSRLGRQYIDRSLRQKGYDVTPAQSRTLIYLACCGGRSVNQRDLERELRLKPSTVNGLVGRLEEKGYILRRTSPEDARCRLVRLTEAGQERVDTFRAVLEEANRHISGGLTGQEAQQFCRLLARVIENLEDEVNGI